MQFTVIRYSKIWLTISAAIVALSLVSLFTFGLNPGIDFSGGSLLEASIPSATVEDVRATLEAAGKHATVQEAGTSGDYLMRFGVMSEADHQAVLSALREKFGDVQEQKFDAVGPSVGESLKRSAAKSVVLLVILIAAYIAWAFRTVSFPVKSWKYGVVTAISAFHDVIIPMGIFAFLSKIYGFEADTAFVAALLTILGYSINDTIVVFDRTRENLIKHRHKNADFGEVVDASVRETLGRSLNTTLTTLLPLVAILLLGGETVRPFILTLFLGILAGAYSSIFLASPLLVLWERKAAKK